MGRLEHSEGAQCTPCTIGMDLVVFGAVYLLGQKFQVENWQPPIQLLANRINLGGGSGIWAVWSTLGALSVLLLPVFSMQLISNRHSVMANVNN